MLVASQRSTNLRGLPVLRSFVAPNGVSQWAVEVAGIVNSVRSGKLNNVCSVTLTANATTTTLTDPLISANSHVSLMPTSATAAAAVGSATGVFVTPGDGTATITHPNTAETDKTFSYSIIGRKWAAHRHRVSIKRGRRSRTGQ